MHGILLERDFFRRAVRKGFWSSFRFRGEPGRCKSASATGRFTIFTESTRKLHGCQSKSATPKYLIALTATTTFPNRHPTTKIDAHRSSNLGGEASIPTKLHSRAVRKAK